RIPNIDWSRIAGNFPRDISDLVASPFSRSWISDLFSSPFWGNIPDKPYLFEVISDLTVDSDCDYVEWTGLDINRDGAYIILADIKNPTESGAGCRIYINGNMTDTNYYNQYIEANGTSIIGGRGNNPGGPYVPAGSECFAVIWVMRDPTGHARTLRLMSWNTPDAVRLTVGTDVTVFTVSNITSIRIQTTQAGGIGAGSRFILCRVKSP
ncbi:hypothetical protein DRJ17_07710, partial [Candidatus Woesearchaeota archaeon]